MARLADFDSRHRAIVTKVVGCAQAGRALERTCKSFRDEVDEHKSEGAHELAVQRQAAEGTIAKLQVASVALEVNLAATMAELLDQNTQPDGIITTLRDDLHAARPARAATMWTGRSNIVRSTWSSVQCTLAHALVRRQDQAFVAMCGKSPTLESEL